MTDEQYKKASDILSKIAELKNENRDLSDMYFEIKDSNNDYINFKVMIAEEYTPYIMVEKKRILYMLDALMRSNVDKIEALRAEFEAI